MISAIHAGLQQLFYELGQVPADVVDVRFEPPRRDWIASLTRPTLSVFLFDVRENTELRQANPETSRANGRAVHRLPPRRFDLRYMVSAMTTVIEDEHLLLWRAMVTLLRYPTLPDHILPPALQTLDPPLATQVSKPDDEGTLLGVWSGLETAPRPALLYTVTTTVDLDISRLSPLVLTRTARYTRVHNSEEAVADVRSHIGGTVRDGSGSALAGARVSVDGRASEGTLTNEEGAFALYGLPAGSITLRVARLGKPPKLMRTTIPSESYDIVVD